MATIVRTVHIEVDPTEAWEALCDFGQLHKRLARGFITDCNLEAPDLRTITFFNGAVARERLVGIEKGSRRLSYTLVESRLGPTHHNGSAQVHPHDGRTRFEWVTDVLPDDVAPAMADLMDRGIKAIKSTLEAV